MREDVDALHQLARIGVEGPAARENLSQAASIIRRVTGAAEAMVVYAEDQDFLVCGDRGDGAGSEFTQAALWIVQRQIIELDGPVAFNLVGHRVEDFTPASSDDEREFLALAVPTSQSPSEMCMLRGPWKNKARAGALEIMESAMPALTITLDRFLNGDRSRRQAEQLNALANAAQVLTLSEDVEPALANLATTIAASTGYEYIVNIDLYDGTTGRFFLRILSEHRHTSGTLAQVWRNSLDSERPEAWKLEIMRTRQPALAADVQNDERVEPHVRQFFRASLIRSVAIFPLLFQDEFLGTMGFVSFKPRTFPPEEVSLLQGFVTQAATALKALHLHGELQRYTYEVRRSVDEYIATTNLTGEIIGKVDKYGNWTFLNDAACQFYGKPREELLATDSKDRVHPEDVEPAVEATQKAAATGEPISGFVNRQVTPTGTRVVEWNASPFFEEDGRYAGMQMTGRDITERQQADEALRENEEAFRLVFENAKDAIFWADPETGLIIRCNRAAESLLERERGEIVGQHQTAVHPPEKAEHYAEMFKRHIEQEGYADDEAEVITKSGRVIPVHIAASVTSVGEKPIIQGIFHDITERKRAEQAVRESEARFRDVAENALEWIWEVDASGKYTYASPVLEKILGYSPEEVLGKHFYDLFHPEDREELKKAAFEAFARKEPFHELPNRNIHKNGKTVWLSTSGIPVLDEDGSLLGYRGADTDITGRKLAEEALQESEQRFRSLSESAPIGIFLTDSQGNCTYANPRLLSMAGLTLEESLGHGWTKVIHPDDRQAVLEEASRAPAEGRDFAREFRLLTAEGELRSVQVHSTPMASADGEQAGRVGTLQDITERKRAEEALRESEGRYRLLAENASDVIWTMDLSLRYTYVSPSFTRMRGYSVEEMMGSTVGDTLTPASLDLARKTLAEELAIEKMPQKDLLRSRTLELEIKCKDGSTVWTEAKVAFLRDPDGRPVGILGVSRDISERKRAEKELCESEERLRTLVTNAPVILFAVDREGVFTLSEGKGLEGLGLRPGEVVGRSVLEVFGDSTRVVGYMQRALDGEPLTVTVDLGGLTFETYFRPVRDHDGDLTGGIGVAIDISERKRAEEAVRASEERYRLLAENATDIIWTMDLGLKYTYISPSVTRMRGYSVEEVMAQTVNESMTPASREVAVKTLAEELAIERMEQKDLFRSRTLELEMNCRDGSTVWCEMKMAFLRDADGQALGILGVTRDISERKKAEEEQERLHAELELRAITDSLTGLYDHAHFYQRLGEELERSRRYNQGFAVVMMDIDDFKRFNEARGHHVGDDMLRLVGDCIRSGLRRSDLAFRYGGDEFAAILPHADSSKARAVVNRINRRIAKSLKQTDGGPAARMSLSAGVACFPEDGITADDLVRVADAALYSAKWVTRARDIMGQREDIQSFVSALVSRRAGVEGPLAGAVFRPEALHEEQARIVSSVASSITVALRDAGVSQALEDPDVQIVAVVGAAAEIKDRYIRGHPERTSEQAVALAEQMGLSPEQVRDIRIAGLLHDIGKVSVSEGILNKPGRLTRREYATIKDHPVVGASLVSQLKGFERVVPITRHHHERFDGTGYPDGLAGEDIPLEARILAVADVFDAMTHQRAYRKALSKGEAVAELRRGAGTQFDPVVVEAFVALVGRGTKEAAAPAEAAI